jgi:DNA-binding MarR family transcriptional regulator
LLAQARQSVILQIVNEYIVSPEGMLAERRPHDAAQWYAEHAGATDLLGLEAHFTLNRAGTLAIEVGRPDGMSLARYNVLRFLYIAPGHRRTMSEIAQRLDVTMTNVTKLIDPLVQSGIVQRLDDHEDKRRTWAELLPAGLELFESVYHKVADQIEQAWAGFSNEEKRVLIHLLAKFRLQVQASQASEAVHGIATDLSQPHDDHFPF